MKTSLIQALQLITPIEAEREPELCFIAYYGYYRAYKEFLHKHSLTRTQVKHVHESSGAAGIRDAIIVIGSHNDGKYNHALAHMGNGNTLVYERMFEKSQAYTC